MRIKIEIENRCVFCEGSGNFDIDDEEYEECPHCNGTGRNDNNDE